MIPTAYPEKPTFLQIATVAVIGAALGFINMLGLLPSAGLVLFLAGVVLIALFKGIYHYMVLSGIVLLAFVFIEPSPSDVILIAAFLIGLAAGTYKPQAMGRAALAAALILAYFIAGLPGIAVSSDQASAIRYCLITFYLFLLSIFVCSYTRRDTIISLLHAYVLAAFFSFAAGLAGLLGFSPDILMADPYRVQGLFKDPNVFGPFFVPAIILLLDDMKHRRILKAPRALHVAGIVLLSLGVVFSYSRAAWVNMIVAALVYFLLNIKSIRMARFMRIALAATAILAAVYLLLLSPLLRDSGIASFLIDRTKLQEYDKDRFSAQQGGLELIIQNPFGVGPGQFEDKVAGITGQRLSAHSLYIRIAAENGIAGFAAFFSAIACMLLLLWFDHLAFRKRQNANPRALAQSVAPIAREPGIGISPVVLIAILSGLLVNSLVVDTLHWRHFWVFIGLALYRLREGGRNFDEYE